MNPILKNILALVGGVVVGGIINMGLIMISSSIVPLPEGVDPTNMESLKENMHLFEAKHFLFPFLAHALGTLVGAWIAAKLSTDKHMMWALVVGLFFLIGGVTNAFVLPAPTWFIALDVIAAYLPMAWIGGRLATRK